jgi:acyl carrier protein
MSADALEKVILEVFREILKDQRVTPESDFFEFGGDSLTAIDASIQISDQTSVEVDMAAIFLYPTPRELSAALAGAAENN